MTYPIKVATTYDHEPSEVIEVPEIHRQGVKLFRVDGLPVVQVSKTTEFEREMVVDAPFHATWLGWHYGQCPAYGNTPEQAARKLAAGLLAE